MATAILSVENALNTLRDTLSDYLARHRLLLYLSLAGVVAGGIVFNWHWLTVSEIVRLLTALPCMLMMFKCLNCGTRRSTERAVSAESRTAQTG
ncbi:hypothetical protein QA641_34010 [Bradyrhizobium sp. CB1650]|uniref:hypothetical protein n=1 Tax=Bradyrhizobium sp. CB1650 TaxID=3039153 RepID=UPI0024352FE2|nr:hypothetical protein [Bradyrhizobium sp. CB1650]WGD50568.1 hypothetical protein QA641_34010 [Bradyrhizobium sp. CB1650]